MLTIRDRLAEIVMDGKNSKHRMPEGRFPKGPRDVCRWTPNAQHVAQQGLDTDDNLYKYTQTVVAVPIPEPLWVYTQDELEDAFPDFRKSWKGFKGESENGRDTEDPNLLIVKHGVFFYVNEQGKLRPFLLVPANGKTLDSGAEAGMEVVSVMSSQLLMGRSKEDVLEEVKEETQRLIGESSKPMTEEKMLRMILAGR